MKTCNLILHQNLDKLVHVKCKNVRGNSCKVVGLNAFHVLQEFCFETYSQTCFRHYYGLRFFSHSQT